MASLHIDWQNRRYWAMIGTGGIGSCMFFALDEPVFALLQE